MVEVTDMLEYTQGEGRYQVRLRALATGGNGLVVFITGGERPHLGGTALAALPPQGCGDLSHCDTWDITLPGHKDKELARGIARKICLATGEPVSVNVGIHTDNASGEDIGYFSRQAEELADRFIGQYIMEKKKHP